MPLPLEGGTLNPKALRSFSAEKTLRSQRTSCAAAGQDLYIATSSLPSSHTSQTSAVRRRSATNQRAPRTSWLWHKETRATGTVNSNISNDCGPVAGSIQRACDMFVYMVGSSIADFHSCIYTLTQQQIGSECQIFSPKLLRKVDRCTLRHSSLLFGRKSKLRQGSFVDKCILCASATWASLAINVHPQTWPRRQRKTCGRKPSELGNCGC